MAELNETRLLAARVELCWTCQEPLGDELTVQARPPHAKLVGGGWHTVHERCLTATWERRPDG